MLQGVGVAADGEPTVQSQRVASYTAAAGRLLADGRAYWCDCTAEEVQARAKERGGPPGYDGHCRDRGVERGTTPALRFRSPDEGSTGFDDPIRGNAVVENKTDRHSVV